MGIEEVNGFGIFRELGLIRPIPSVKNMQMAVSNQSHLFVSHSLRFASTVNVGLFRKLSGMTVQSAVRSMVASVDRLIKSNVCVRLVHR